MYYKHFERNHIFSVRIFHDEYYDHDDNHEKEISLIDQQIHRPTRDRS